MKTESNSDKQQGRLLFYSRYSAAADDVHQLYVQMQCTHITFLLISYILRF